MAQELKSIRGGDIHDLVEFGDGSEIYHAETLYYLKNVADEALDEKDTEIHRLKRALWLARAERYKMLEFIAREKANLRDYLEWSRNLRQRLYHQWVDQLLRIANLANKLHNKCRSKAEEYK